MFSTRFCPDVRLLPAVRPALVLGLPFAALWLHAAPARGEDAVSIEVERAGQVGQATPALTVVVRAELTELNVNLKCGSTPARSVGPARSGARVRIELPVPQGKHRCEGTLSITLPDGSGGDLPLRFEVEQHPPMKIQVTAEGVDTEARRLTLQVDRATDSVEVDVYGVDGLIGGGKGPGGPAGSALDLSWTDKGAEALRLEVKATDKSGFWGKLDLYPWHYDVPHVDVVFGSGDAAIAPSEVPKLSAALAEINAVVAKYGAVAPVKLYVAGFTDTVGDGAKNQRLSELRARAIAEWFKAQGFSGPVFVRGLGENGLLVPTPDETDELRNRRATYILAADAPPSSAALPAGTWAPLR